MLSLRRGIVLAAGSLDGPMQQLDVRLGGERRPALADVALVGPARTGDEVVVNLAAVDLDPGAGGYDLVHVNLTRGLRGTGEGGGQVMKLDGTSLQHPVAPAEATAPAPEGAPGGGRRAAAHGAPVGDLPAARPARAAGVGVRARRPGRAARLRPDRGRRAAGRAVADRAPAARPRPAGRPRHGRRRPTAASPTP